VYRDAWNKPVTTAVREGKQPPPMPKEATPPKPVSKPRLWIVDAAAEMIARILAGNPGGLICFRDELSGLLGAFDKSGGAGSDRAFWLEAYGGRSYRFDRVSLKGEAIDIPFCAVSLLGGLQPDRLYTMILSGDDDGLASRPSMRGPIQCAPVAQRRCPTTLHSWQPCGALRVLNSIGTCLMRPSCVHVPSCSHLMLPTSFSRGG
jgi:hypothetical protein